MSGLLLGTTGLQQLIAEDAVLKAWLDGREEPLFAATPSVASLLVQAERVPQVRKRWRWVEALRKDVPEIFGPRLKAFDILAAASWSALRLDLEAELDKLLIPENELYVVAIALAEGFDYVEPRQTWHESIPALRQHDPWTGQSYPT